MARKAVAATLASVALFTVLVVADATVMAAQDNLASEAQTLQIESAQAALEKTLAGSVSLSALAEVQDYLSSNAADCGSLPQYLGSISASNSTSGEDGGVAYSASARVAEVAYGGASADNLTLIAPFAGEVPGGLDLRDALTIEETGGGGSVSLERRETHSLNVPVEVDSASSLCSTTSGALAAALSSTGCNSTLEQGAFDVVIPGLVAAAAADGFALSAGWMGGCPATYWFTLVEPGVEGAAGSFDWTVLGSGVS